MPSPVLPRLSSKGLPTTPIPRPKFGVWTVLDFPSKQIVDHITKVRQLLEKTKQTEDTIRPIFLYFPFVWVSLLDR
jgi:hypothetical protein